MIETCGSYRVSYRVGDDGTTVTIRDRAGAVVWQRAFPTFDAAVRYARAFCGLPREEAPS